MPLKIQLLPIPVVQTQNFPAHNIKILHSLFGTLRMSKSSGVGKKQPTRNLEQFSSNNFQQPMHLEYPSWHRQQRPIETSFFRNNTERSAARGKVFFREFYVYSSTASDFSNIYSFLKFHAGFEKIGRHRPKIATKQYQLQHIQIASK